MHPGPFQTVCFGAILGANLGAKPGPLFAPAPRCALRASPC